MSQSVSDKASYRKASLLKIEQEQSMLSCSDERGSVFSDEIGVESQPSMEKQSQHADNISGKHQIKSEGLNQNLQLIIPYSPWIINKQEEKRS